MSESQLRSLLLLYSDFIHFVIVAKKNPFETYLIKIKKNRTEKFFEVQPNFISAGAVTVPEGSMAARSVLHPQAGLDTKDSSPGHSCSEGPLRVAAYLEPLS